MSTALTGDESPSVRTSVDTAAGMKRLLVLFALSGTAGLIYEVAWFQLLRLTIGASSQSLGALLACFMGGLFVGSLLYAYAAPRRWHPLKTYAMIELAIGVIGLAMPYLIGLVRTSYLAHAESARTAMLLRCLICALFLAPPTILMGATLPALSRWIKSNNRQAAAIGRLYAANIIGAVAGALGAAFLLLPALQIIGANRTAAALNLLVALIAWTIRGDYTPPPRQAPDTGRAISSGTTVILLAYALNGVASLSFEVVWARLLSMAFGATVYAFAIVLGAFLLGLGLGGAAGSTWGPRLKNPRRAFAAVQLCVLAAVSGTALLVPAMAKTMTSIDTGPSAGPLIWSLTNLVRALAVVLPGAFLWGASFPIALLCLGRNLGDAAKPVAHLYAFNTVGAVLGSLAVSFVLIPSFGSATATAHLIVVPLVAAVVLLLPRRVPAWFSFALAGAAIVFAYGTPLASHCNQWIGTLIARINEMPDLGYILAIPLLIGVILFIATRVRYWWAYIAAGGGIALALTASVPPQLYMLGRHFAYQTARRDYSEVILFEEGAMEPVVVFYNIDGSMQVAINSKVCATAQPPDMQTQRLLGHLPVLFSSDPGHSVVVGLGAGVTSGAVAIHENVERIDIIELEPKVELAAREFAEFNHAVMDNPKVRLTIDDGRHFISASSKKFGVITSDPVDPWMAGAAAIYTEGGFWITPRDILMIGSTRKITIDVDALRRRLETEPAIAESLACVGIHSVEELLGCYLCSCQSLDGFLAGAPVNRDSNLYIQFSGGFSFYDWDQPPLSPVMAAHRAYDPQMFLLPEGQEQSFREALQQQWRLYDEVVVARENELYRQQQERRSP